MSEFVKGDLIRFQADADLHHGIVVAVRKYKSSIEFASSADAKLDGVSDPEVLEIADRAGRILISHDRSTMIDHFRMRLAEGKSSPGVFLVSQFAPFGPVVEALVTIWSASIALDWRNQIRYLPSLSRHIFSR